MYAELVDDARRGPARPATSRWNFEKFLVASDGAVIARFSPTVVPDDERVVSAIEGLVGA